MKKLKITAVVFFSLVASYTNCRAQKSNISVGNAHMMRYPDSVKANRRDTSWVEYIVNFATDSPAKVKDFYVCVGSQNDTADIVYQKVTVKSLNNKFYTECNSELPVVAGRSFCTIVYVKRKDIPKISQYHIYVEDMKGRNAVIKSIRHD